MPTLPTHLSPGQAYSRWAARLKPNICAQTERSKLIALRAWSGELTTTQAERIAMEIARLGCQGGSPEAWLMETLLQPEMASPQNRMALFFSLAVYERWTASQHLAVQTWLESPSSKAKRNFGWHVYLRLVEAGYARLPGEFLLAGPSRRHAIIIEAIRDACHRDPVLLTALSREVFFLQQKNALSAASAGAV